ncbi:MAG: response regulator transcription factor [Bacteroidota bacterium]|nr:response regulator transcription factor [Bacteroidota bacterium]
MHDAITRVATLGLEVNAIRLLENTFKYTPHLELDQHFDTKHELIDYLKSSPLEIIIISEKFIKNNDLSDFIQELKDINNSIRLIFLTEKGDFNTLFPYFRAGASGYILENSRIDIILNTIEIVSKGGIFITEQLLKQIIKILDEKFFIFNDLKLTKREEEVVNLFCEGSTHREIAKKLFISPETVRTHLRNFHSKSKDSKGGKILFETHKSEKIKKYLK